MSITASKLRENVYRILDEVLATGVPVEIERNGRTLRIVPTTARSDSADSSGVPRWSSAIPRTSLPRLVVGLASVIRLDTHVVVWLYTGELERFTEVARESLEHDDLVVSPIVELELTYLHEIGRLSVAGTLVTADLRERVGWCGRTGRSPRS